MNSKGAYSLLTYGGALPFIACALLSVANVELLFVDSSVLELANGYALAIVSFLSGIHWATYLYKEQDLPINLLVISNIVFLVAWFGYILASTTTSLAVQIVALLSLLAIDRGLLSHQLLNAHYFRTRTIATVIATVSLAILLGT